MAELDGPDFWERVPSPRDLAFFVDLAGFLQKPQPLKDLVGRLAERGWRGGASVLYAKVSQIEQMLQAAGERDGQLIERGRGLGIARLTPAGEQFARRASQVLAHYRHSLRRAGADREQLLIGATNAIMTYLLPVFFASEVGQAFLTGRPLLDLHFIDREWDDCLTALHYGHIVLGMGPDSSASTIPHCPQLLTESPRVLQHPSAIHFERPADGQPFNLSQLADHSVLLLPPGVQPDLDYDRLVPAPAGRGRRIYLPTYAIQRVWVRHGLGVAFGHEGHVLPGETPLPTIPLGEQLGTTRVYLYLPPGGLKAVTSEAGKELAQAMLRWFRRGNGSVKPSSVRTRPLGKRGRP